MYNSFTYSLVMSPRMLDKHDLCPDVLYSSMKSMPCSVTETHFLTF